MGYTTTANRERTLQLLGGACLVAAAFNARTIFSSTAAVLPEMVAGLGISQQVASLLTALPIICMGIFAPLAAGIANRWGSDRTIFLAMGLLCVAIALRSVGDLPLLLVGTIAAGLAIAGINVLLPVITKRRFSSRPALMTSLYTTAIGAGAACGAALTVPIDHVLGMGWRWALLSWLTPALIALALFSLLQAFAPARPEPLNAPRRGLWHDRAAVQMTLFFGLHSGLSYSVFVWLAPILTSRGMEPSAAGYVVALTIAGQMVGTLTAPHLATRLRDLRYLNPILALGSASALASFVYCPLSAVVWLAPVQGILQGSLLAVSMTLIVLRSNDAITASSVSAMVQSTGMAMAAITPFLVGLSYGWTGTFDAAALLFIAIGLSAAGAGFGAGRSGSIGTDHPSP